MHISMRQSAFLMNSEASSASEELISTFDCYKSEIIEQQSSCAAVINVSVICKN